MGSFDTGRALGQSAINATLDMKMQQQRQNLVQQQMRTEQQMRQEKMRIESEAMQSMATGLSELRDLESSGKLTAEALRDVKIKYIKPALASPQAASLWDKATSLYAHNSAIERQGEEKIAESKLWDEYNELTAYAPKPTGENGEFDREAARQKILELRKEKQDTGIPESMKFNHYATMRRGLMSDANNPAIPPSAQREAKKTAEVLDSFIERTFGTESLATIKAMSEGEPAAEDPGTSGGDDSSGEWQDVGGFKVRIKAK